VENGGITRLGKFTLTDPEVGKFGTLVAGGPEIDDRTFERCLFVARSEGLSSNRLFRDTGISGAGKGPIGEIALDDI
jgi:hypothetical protein